MGHGSLICGFRLRVRIVGQSSQHWLAPDLLVLEDGGEMIWVWRPKSQRPMWPPAVVVGTVLGKDTGRC
jgi:hypothetical protein